MRSIIRIGIFLIAPLFACGLLGIASCNSVAESSLSSKINEDQRIVRSFNDYLSSGGSHRSSPHKIESVKRRYAQLLAINSYEYKLPVSIPIKISDTIPFIIKSFKLIGLGIAVDQHNGVPKLSQLLIFECCLTVKRDTMLTNRLYASCYFADKQNMPIITISEPIYDDRNIYSADRVYIASKRYTFRTSVVNGKPVENIDHVVFTSTYE